MVVLRPIQNMIYMQVLLNELQSIQLSKLRWSQQVAIKFAFLTGALFGIQPGPEACNCAAVA